MKPPAVWNFTRITLPFVYGIGVGGYTIIMYVGELHNSMLLQTPALVYHCQRGTAPKPFPKPRLSLWFMRLLQKRGACKAGFSSCILP